MPHWFILCMLVSCYLPFYNGACLGLIVSGRSQNVFFLSFGKYEGKWGICEHVFKKGHFVVSTENGGRVMGLVKFFFFYKTVIDMKVWKMGNKKEKKVNRL